MRRDSSDNPEDQRSNEERTGTPRYTQQGQGSQDRFQSQQPPQQGPESFQQGHPPQGPPQQGYPPQGQPPTQGQPPRGQPPQGQPPRGQQQPPGGQPPQGAGQSPPPQSGSIPPGVGGAGGQQEPPGMQQAQRGEAYPQTGPGQPVQGSAGGPPQTQPPMGQQTQGMAMGQPGRGMPMGQQQTQLPVGQQPMGPRLQPVTVEDIVQTDVVTAERDTPVVTVVAQMAEKDVGSVVIVEDETPVGIVTDRGIALALETTSDLSETPVEEVMGDNLVSGTTDMTVFKAVRRMREENVRRLPIVDEDGTLEGILTLDDVLVLLGSELNNATEIIKSQSPRM